MTTELHRCLLLALACARAAAFHDCVQPRSAARAPPGAAAAAAASATAAPNCSGGLCLGMHGGPHEGGPAAYSVGDAASGFTSVFSLMTVPALPKKQDGICYYIWTDVYFGHMSLGRMNQFVPQLLVGDALDGSTGPPDYFPRFGVHTTWAFAAHYFFEVFDPPSNSTIAHAAYGDMHPARAGETLFTNFSVLLAADGVTPHWQLQMGVLGDASRVSTLLVEQPYMGLGAAWDVPTTSWAETNYTNMWCVAAHCTLAALLCFSFLFLSRRCPTPLTAALTPAGRFMAASTPTTSLPLAPTTQSPSHGVGSRRTRGLRSGTKTRGKSALRTPSQSRTHRSCRRSSGILARPRLQYTVYQQCRPKTP